MASITNRSAPSLSGVQLESSNYQVMGIGLTDRIFLLGHGNLSLNDPYQVVSIQAAIDALGADTNAPLMRGMIESYYAGARDIYLVSVAPMVEYVANWIDRIQIPVSSLSSNMIQIDPSWSPPSGYTEDQWDALNFFQRYDIRLQNAYTLLGDWDLPQFIVPLNAYYYNVLGTDFLTPLAKFCDDHFNTTGSVCIGFLGGQLQKGLVGDSVIQQGWTADIIADLEQGLSGLGGRNEPFRLSPTSYIETPDSAQLSSVGDLDLRAVISLDHWVSSSSQIRQTPFAPSSTVGLTAGTRYNGFLLYENNGLDAFVRIRDTNAAGNILEEITFHSLDRITAAYPVGLHANHKLYIELVSGSVAGYILWSPLHTPDQTIISKTNVTAEQSYLFGVTEEGRLSFGHSTTSVGPMDTEVSSIAVTAADKDKLWIRATLVVNDGFNNNEVKFYTSSDGIAWDQLGIPFTRPGVTSIYDGTAPIGIGTIPANPTLAPATGFAYYVEIRNGVDGTIIANPSFMQLEGGI